MFNCAPAPRSASGMIDHHAIVREFDGQDYTFSHTSPGRLNYPSTCDQIWCAGNLLSGMKSTAPSDTATGRKAIGRLSDHRILRDHTWMPNVSILR